MRDSLDDGAALDVETRELQPTCTLKIPMRAAGGFVVRY